MLLLYNNNITRKTKTTRKMSTGINYTCENDKNIKLRELPFLSFIYCDRMVFSRPIDMLFS